MIVKDMDQTQEAVKKLLDSSKKILVAREPSTNEATILAALALKNVLESAGKGVFLFPQPGETFTKKFEKILPKEDNRTLPQKIKIKIPKNIPLEEMSCEEDGEFLNLIISPKTGLEPENLVIEKSPYEMDMAFCFFSGKESWKKIAAPVVKPAPEKIIYFTNKDTSLAEKVNGLRAELVNGSAVSMRAATILYASLVFETENFQLNQGPGVFGLAKELLESGADKNTLKEILAPDKKSNATQMIGRALARTTFEEELKTSWTFLTRQDFLKTGFGATKDNLLFILRKVRSQISPADCSVICYENENGAGSLIFHEDENVLKNLSLGLGASMESPYFFASGFKNFSEAETKIRQLLKQNISATIK